MTLVPLPQIDHIYARLRGSQVFSTFDLEVDIITWNCPQKLEPSLLLLHLWTNLNLLGAQLLEQAPAYFQRLMNQVIKGLPFAFVHLDDVLIHSQILRHI